MANDVNINVNLNEKGVTDGAGAASKSVRKLGLDVSDLSGQLKTIGKGAAVGFAALSGAATASVVAFAKFDNEIRGVKTLLDQTSFGAKGLEKGFEDMRKDLLDLGATSGQSLSKLNKALFDTVSAGIDAGDAVEVVGVSAKLAVAGLTDVSIATDGMTSALNAYGDAAGDADDVAAAFFTAQKFGKTTIEELASSFGVVGSNAEAAGVKFEELLGATSAVTAAGVSTSAAMVGLKAVIANVSKPTADAAKEAKRLGVEFNAAALRSQGLEGFLKSLSTAQGFTKDSVTKLFGSVQAQGVAFALTGKQADSFSRNVAELNDKQKAGATLSAAYAVQNQSLSRQFETLKGLVTVVATEFGQELAPSFGLVVAESTKFFNQIRDDGTLKNFANSVGSTLKFVVDAFTFTFTFLPDVIAAFAVKIANIAGGIARVLKGVFTLDPKEVSAGIDETGKAVTKSFSSILDEMQAIRENEKVNSQIFAKPEEVQQQGAATREAVAAENEKDKEIQKTKEQEAADARREAFEAKLAQDEEFRDILGEVNEENRLSDKEIKMLGISTDAEEERTARLAIAKQLEDDQKKANQRKLQEQIKYGKAFATINAFINSEEVQGTKKATSELTQLTQSKNSTLKGIGKAASVANITIKTAESAQNIYAGFSTIPIVGVPLGIAGAAAAVAFGAENIAKVTAARQGGRITGGVPNIPDSVPAALDRGEFVTPAATADETIDARARELIEQEESDSSEGGGSSVMIGFDGDEAERVITTRQNEASALGISEAI